MAGGTGTRLWPISQSSLPKQFIDLAGVGRTMLQLTFARFRKLCTADHIVVVTLNDYREIVEKQLPELPSENILCEPFKRNTSACIAYAEAWVKQHGADNITVVSPSDHLIIDDNVFIDSMHQAVEYVQDKNTLLAVGVKAFRPDTSFGYIQVGEQISEGINAVRTFTEKPNQEMAETFYECGDFCWNSGVFVWRGDAIGEAMHRYLPELAAQFDTLDNMPLSHWTEAAIRRIYEEVQSISVDYGIMEKARNVVVTLTDAVWSDLGSYDALYEQGTKDGNSNCIIGGTTLLKSSSGCLVHTDTDSTCIVEGLTDYIVAQRGKTIIICPRSNSRMTWQYKSELKAEFD